MFSNHACEGVGFVGHLKKHEKDSESQRWYMSFKSCQNFCSVSSRWAWHSDKSLIYPALPVVYIVFSYQTGKVFGWFRFAYWTQALKSNLSIFLLVCSTSFYLIWAKTQIPADIVPEWEGTKNVGYYISSQYLRTPSRFTSVRGFT